MADDLAADAEPVMRWLDAFPWIESAASDLGDATGDPHAMVAGARRCQRRLQSRAERLADLSDLALEHLTRWTIGQIFPGLPADTVLSPLPMTNRARNALGPIRIPDRRRSSGSGTGRIARLAQVGIGTVDSMLQALGDAATSDASQALLAAQSEGARLPRAAQDEDEQASARNRALHGGPPGDRELVCRGGTLPARPLLGTAIPPGSPAEVFKARHRLELINASRHACQEMKQSSMRPAAAALRQRP